MVTAADDVVADLQRVEAEDPYDASPTLSSGAAVSTFRLDHLVAAQRAHQLALVHV